MKTITLTEPGAFAFSETSEPAAPGSGEVMVRVRQVGICGTDYHAYRGRQPFFSYPRILGHELGVIVEAVGADVNSVRVGDQCAVEPYLNCGKCIACRRGKSNCCSRLQVLGVHTDGGMRDQIIVPAHKLHRSEILPLEQLALVETLGIGAHAVERAGIEKGETVLITGAGPIGLSVLTFVLASGAGKIIVRDVSGERLAFCRTAFGVTNTISTANADEALVQLNQLTDNDLPTVVFDATGNPSSMQDAFRCVAPGGKLIFVGLFSGDVTFHDPDFHRREITLYASRNSRPEDFTRIISLMESGAINTSPWITHRMPAESLPAAFPDLLKPDSGVLKAIVEF